MKCPNCNAIIPSDSDICPACFSPVQTAPEPLAPPPPAAPVAHPLEGRIQPEASRKSREGQQCTPLSENATGRNTEGRFSRQASRKPLFIAAGVLAVIIIAIAGYMVLNDRQAPVPPPVAQEKPAPAPETQAPEKPAPAPEAPAEAKQAPEKPVPPVQKKTAAKRVPKASTPKAQTPAPAPAATPKWTYRPDPQPVKPAPKPQAQKAGIGAWLDKALGPEKPVTPPPAVNDARGSGM